MADIPDAELAQLRQQAEAGQSAAAALEKSQQDLAALDQLYQATKTALIETARTAHPNIPPDLITGDTPDEVKASIERGQAIVDQVKAANTQATTTPSAPVTAAAPPRTDQPPEGLRGAARIRYGIEQMKEQ